MDEVDQDKIRLEIADVLDAIAAESAWNDELWSRFDALRKRAVVDSFIALADEELIHYSGVFNQRNIFLMRVKPDKTQVQNYKEQFRQIAQAIRTGMPWEEYYRNYEEGSLNVAFRNFADRIRKLLKSRKDESKG